MDTIKVSVLMLSYNHGKYIEKAMRSAADQNVNFKYEIIVGDDASPDDSQEEIKKVYKEYPDKVVPVLREKNLGAMKNMIDLVSRAKGEYIAFLEGDDFWTDINKLQKQVDFLDSHLDYVACCHKRSTVDENGNIISEVDDTHRDIGDYTVEDFSDYILPGHTATYLLKKSALFKIYDNKKVLTEKNMMFIPGDRLLALCLLSFGKIYCSDEMMSAYRFVIKEGGTNWSSKHMGESAFVYFYNVNTFRQIEKLGKTLGIPMNFKEKEFGLFREVYWQMVKCKKCSYFLVLLYTLLISRQRAKLMRYYITMDINRLKGSVKRFLKKCYKRLLGKEWKK